MKNASLISAIAFILIAACSTPHKPTVSADSQNSVDRYFQTLISSGHLKGAHGLIFHGDKIIYDQTFGSRNADANAPMHGDEIYFIQSMTKPIISVALMTLYEEGRFRLDDPIEKYLPEFSHMLVVNDPAQGIKGGTHPAPTKITIAQLLSHTSGLSNGLASSAFDQDVRKAISDSTIKTIEQRVKALSMLPLNYDPGTKWNYSFSTDL